MLRHWVAGLATARDDSRPVSFNVPKSLQRLVVEIDGWLDLECHDRALEKTKRLLEHPGARPVGLTLRAQALAGLKRYEEALEVIAELRDLPHEPEWVAVTEGWCLRRVDDLPGAIRCMERLIARDRSSAIGYYNLACYQALSDEPDLAIANLARAVRLDRAFVEHARGEDDFTTIRTDPRFRELIGIGD